MADGENYGASNQDLISRVAVLESRQRDIRIEIQEIRRSDLREIKTDIRALREDFSSAERGLSTPEKIALLAAGSAVVGAIVTVIALLSGTGAP